MPSRLVDDYYLALTASRNAEANSLTDQLCGFLDLIKAVVKRSETGKALNALDQFKELLTKMRDRLELRDEQREINHRELLALAATHDLPISTAIIKKETDLMA
jgi:hypothetical protein